MEKFLICYDLSKDGSQRLSQITSDTMYIAAESEQQAIEEAKASIEGVTGQTVIDIWVPVSPEKDTLPPELRALYPIEKYGHWGE